MPSAAGDGGRGGRARWSSRRSPAARPCALRNAPAVRICARRRRRARAIATARRPLASARAHAVGMRGRDRCAAPAAPCPAPRRGRPSCSPCPSPCRCRRSARAAPLTSSICVVVDLGRRGARPRSAGSRCTRRAARPCGGRRASARPVTHDRRHVGASRRPSAAPGRSCRSRRSARPRRAAARGSSPRCPSPSGCAGTCWSGARTTRAARSSGTPPAARRPA